MQRQRSLSPLEEKIQGYQKYYDDLMGDISFNDDVYDPMKFDSLLQEAKTTNNFALLDAYLLSVKQQLDSRNQDVPRGSSGKPLFFLPASALGGSTAQPKSENKTNPENDKEAQKHARCPVKSSFG